MRRTILLLFILATPVLADDPQVHVSQNRFVPADSSQRSSIPTSEEQRTRSLAAVSSARDASIAAANAWYEWDAGAVAERNIELARLAQLNTNAPAHVEQTNANIPWTTLLVTFVCSAFYLAKHRQKILMKLLTIKQEFEAIRKRKSACQS
jgi:hypothetical protein